MPKQKQGFPVGRTIVAVRKMTPKEVEAEGWNEPTVVLVLDDGSILFPSRDAEGNDAGMLFGVEQGQSIIVWKD